MKTKFFSPGLAGMAACLAAAVTTPSPLHGADSSEAGTPLLNLSLEQLGEIKVDTVFAASMFTQKVTDAPSAVSIVTKDEIRRFGYRTLGDIVQGVRGFDVTYDRSYTTLGVRGFNRLGDFGGRTLLLIDGHRMNDPIFDTAAGGNDFLLDVDLIERVEFIRGPGSAIYGNNAFFGVINVITRKPADVANVEVTGSAGSYDTYRGRTTYGAVFPNGVKLLLSGSYFSSDGPAEFYFKEFDSPKTNHGRVRGRDEEIAPSLFGSIQYADFTLQGGYVDREKHTPTAPFGTVFNRDTVTYDTRGYLELQYARKLSSGLELAARAHYDQYDYHGTFPYETDDGKPLLNQDSARARWIGFAAHASWAFTERIRLSLGIDWRAALELRQRNYDESPYNLILDRNGDQNLFGTFLETQIDLTSKLTLNAGVRYDYYSTFGSTANPRVGLIYKAWKSTVIKLLYGQAFRAPNEFELNYRAPGAEQPAGISPERIRTFELVGEHYFNTHWRTTASVFYSRIADLIDPVADVTNPTLVQTGARDAELAGASLEAEGKLANGLLVRASYTRQRATDRATDLILTNSPEDVAKAQLSVPLVKDRIFAGIEGVYSSDRFTLERNRTGDAWLLNATLFTRELLPNLEASISVYNLLNQEIRIPGGAEHLQDRLEQDGRTFRLRINYRF